MEGNNIWSVERQRFADAVQRVEDALTEQENESAIIYGKIEDLRRDGECWALEERVWYVNWICYLETESGRLVLMWQPPEKLHGR